MQLNLRQKRDTVTKIKNSNTFQNAPTSIALLQYLFEQTLNGIRLKESIIDIEFFGNKLDSEKNNPRVRVNVYNLRKKLISYYENEGINDIWRLTIDKGQYHVRFYKKESQNIFHKKINWPKILPYLGLLSAIVLIIYTNTTPKAPIIWNNFLSNNSPTNLFIGDHFGATGKTITNGTGWTRDFDINSITEFYELIEKNPELKNTLKPSNYSYTTRMAALATQKFQQLFQKHKKTFNIRFSTQTSISEIKEGNAIYVGPTKNKNQFIHFFNTGNPYFKITGNTLTLSNHPKLEDNQIEINNSTHDEEFAVVSKYPSTNNTEHIVFFSQHDIGVSATVEYFTNIDSLKSFRNSYLKDSKYFTAIFKVKGQDRTNTSIDLVSVIVF